MPLTATDMLNLGPPGIEGVHEWHSGDGAQVFALGAQAPADLGYGLSRSVVRTMPGFRSSADISDQREPRSGRIGEVPRPVTPLGKTYTVEGELQGVSFPALRRLQAVFEAAFSERDLEGTFRHLTDPAYADTSSYWQSTGRVMQADVDDQLIQAPGAGGGGAQAGFDAGLFMPYRFGFILGVRMSDSRFQWSAQQTVNSTTSVSVGMLGSAQADPVVTILTGAGANAIISDTLGRKLTLLAQPGGEHVVFTFGRRLISSLERPTHDYTQDMDDDNSDWWDPGVVGLAPGVANAVRQTGATGITVQYYPRNW